jgi:hypothetical protein
MELLKEYNFYWQTTENSITEYAVMFMFHLLIKCFVLVQFSEICTPHFLAASIFTAQYGGALYYINAKLLVLLCLTLRIRRLVLLIVVNLCLHM